MGEKVIKMPNKTQTLNLKYNYQIIQGDGNILQAEVKPVIPYEGRVEIYVKDKRKEIIHYYLYDIPTKEILRNKTRPMPAK